MDLTTETQRARRVDFLENREIPILQNHPRPSAGKHFFDADFVLSVGMSPADKTVFLCVVCNSVVNDLFIAHGLEDDL